MSKREAPLDAIKKYIPAPAAERIFQYLNQYSVHLTITKERKSVLGDYRHATSQKTHRISINGNLNRYSFLITLIHELAHLVTYIEYKHRVEPHGPEWKRIYALLLRDFMNPQVFPADLLRALDESMHDLPASSCSDEKLMRALRKYDNPGNGMVLVEQIQEGNLFDAGKGQLFRKGKKLRKRYQCVDISTGRLYLFSAVYEVKAIS